MPYREVLCARLPPKMADMLRTLNAQDAAKLEEIRIYAGCPAELAFADRCCVTDVRMDRDAMDGLLAALCGCAMYRFERELAQGYIPLPGGHRAGVCGRMMWENGVWQMGSVTSVCIRISRDVQGASASIRPYLLGAGGEPLRTLLLGPPGCGKTTALRDAALWLAGERGLRVAAADEREEIAGGRSGLRLDVLGGMEKAHAFSLLLRSMSPQVIITDEIGRAEDGAALLDAVRCGVGVVATAHTRSLEEAAERPLLRRLLPAFDQCILLGKHGCVRAVKKREADGVTGIKEGAHGLEWGGDGDDRGDGDGLSAFGWGETARAVDSRDAALPAADERNHPL